MARFVRAAPGAGRPGSLWSRRAEGMELHGDSSILASQVAEICTLVARIFGRDAACLMLDARGEKSLAEARRLKGEGAEVAREGVKITPRRSFLRVAGTGAAWRPRGAGLKNRGLKLFPGARRRRRGVEPSGGRLLHFRADPGNVFVLRVEFEDRLDVLFDGNVVALLAVELDAFKIRPGRRFGVDRRLQRREGGSVVAGSYRFLSFEQKLSGLGNVGFR
jgi:hypothetical protein